MSHATRWLSAFALSAAWAATACGDDHDDHDHVHDAGTSAVCREISEACHAVDDGTPGLVNTCHEIGHGTNEALCIQRRDECLAACRRDGGGDASHEGSGH